MYRVYWTEENDEAHARDYADLMLALDICNRLREAGLRFVTMVSEDTNMVGKAGAAMVRDGKLPDGENYHWTKNDRVGAAFKTPQ